MSYEETAIDYLFCHVLILRLPRSINEQKLASSYSGNEIIKQVRLIGDPTFIGKSAVILKFNDSIATNTALVRISLMLKGSPAVVVNASAYVRTCADYLELDECVKRPHRIIARGLTRHADHSLYLSLFGKFGTIKQHQFIRIGSDYVLIAEYSCAIECLVAQLCLSGRVMLSSRLEIQRVPHCYFPIPPLEQASRLLTSNAQALQSEEEDTSKTEILSLEYLQSLGLKPSGSLLDLESLPNSDSSKTEILSLEYLQSFGLKPSGSLLDLESLPNSESSSKTQSISSSDFLPYPDTRKTDKPEIQTLDVTEIQEATEKLSISEQKTFSQKRGDEMQRQIAKEEMAIQTSSTIERDVKVEMAKKFGAIPKQKTLKQRKIRKGKPKRDSSSDS